MSLMEELKKFDLVFTIDAQNFVDSLRKVMSGRKQSKKVSSLYIGALSGIIQSSKATISKDELVNLLLNVYGYDTETVKKLGKSMTMLKQLAVTAKAEGYKVKKKGSSVRASKDLDGLKLDLKLGYNKKDAKTKASVELSTKTSPDQIQLAKLLQSPQVKALAKGDFKIKARWIDYSAKKSKNALKKKWSDGDFQQKSGDLYKDLLSVVSIDPDMSKFRPESIFETLAVSIKSAKDADISSELAIGCSTKKKKIKRVLDFCASCMPADKASWDKLKALVSENAALLKTAP